MTLLDDIKLFLKFSCSLSVNDFFTHPKVGFVRAWAQRGGESARVLYVRGGRGAGRGGPGGRGGGAAPFEKCIFRCSFDHPMLLFSLTSTPRGARPPLNFSPPPRTPPDPPGTPPPPPILRGSPILNPTIHPPPPIQPKGSPINTSFFFPPYITPPSPTPNPPYIPQPRVPTPPLARKPRVRGAGAYSPELALPF